MLPTPTPVERRFGRRARADFAVLVRERTRTSKARCIDLSAGGLLLDRGVVDEAFGRPLYFTVDLALDPATSIRATARPVWSNGSLQAVRLVRMSDADRLTLAEHVDLAGRY